MCDCAAACCLRNLDDRSEAREVWRRCFDRVCGIFDTAAGLRIVSAARQAATCLHLLAETPTRWMMTTNCLLYSREVGHRRTREERSREEKDGRRPSRAWRIWTCCYLVCGRKAAAAVEVGGRERRETRSVAARREAASGVRDRKRTRTARDGLRAIVSEG
jgi:hypothetical protein